MTPRAMTATVGYLLDLHEGCLRHLLPRGAVVTLFMLLGRFPNGFESSIIVISPGLLWGYMKLKCLRK